VTSIRTFLALGALVLFTAQPARAQGTAELALALQGMDVVSYFKAGGPVKGQTALHLDFDGARYLFASTQNKAAFAADPDRYLPQFSGLCVTGIAAGKEFKGDPGMWKIIDGKLYFFSAADRVPAAGREPETVARANQSWAAKRK
jgi:YHS domain-containing protein